MSWAEEDWTVGLSGRVLQKVKELQVHHERLSRENKQKQLQLDNIHISLEKQSAKYEEVRGELQYVQRELQSVREEAKAAVISKERQAQDFQTKQAQVCSLEGQLDTARTLNNKLTQEIKRLEAELEKLQNSSRADTTLFSTPCWNTPLHWEQNGRKDEERLGHRDEAQSRAPHIRQRLQFSDMHTNSLPRQHKSTPHCHPSDQSESFSTPLAAFPWERDDARQASRRESPSSPQIPCIDVVSQGQSPPVRSGKENHRTEADISLSEMQNRVSCLEEELSVKAKEMKSIQSDLVQSQKDLAARELSLQKARNELSVVNTRVTHESERASGAEQRLKQLQEELKCQRQNAESSRLQYQQRTKDLEKQHQRDLMELQKERQSLEKQHQQEVNKLNQELQQARVLHNALQAQADKLSLQKQALDKELDALKEKLKWTEGQLQESQKKEALIQAKLTEALREAEAMAVSVEQGRKRERGLEEEGRRLTEERADALKLLKDLQEQKAATAPPQQPVQFCPVGQSFSAQPAYTPYSQPLTYKRPTVTMRNEQKKPKEDVDERSAEITSYPSDREPGEGIDSEHITVLISTDSESLQREEHRMKSNEEETKARNEAIGCDSSGKKEPFSFDHTISSFPRIAAGISSNTSVEADHHSVIVSAEKTPSVKTERAKASEDLLKENAMLRSEIKDAREELQKRLEDLEGQRRAEAEARTRLKQLSRKYASQAAEKEDQEKEFRAQLENERTETNRLRKAMATLEMEMNSREKEKKEEREDQEEEKYKALEDRESEMTELNIQLKKQLTEVKTQLAFEREERKREEEEWNHITNRDKDVKAELSTKLEELRAELEKIKHNRNEDEKRKEKLSAENSPLVCMTLHDDELNCNIVHHDNKGLLSPAQHLFYHSTNQLNLLVSQGTADLIQEDQTVIDSGCSPLSNESQAGQLTSDLQDTRQNDLGGSSLLDQRGDHSYIQKCESASLDLTREVERLHKENTKETERANQYKVKLQALQSQVTCQTKQLTMAFEKQSQHILGLLSELQEKESTLLSQGEELQRCKQTLDAFKAEKEVQNLVDEDQREDTRDEKAVESPPTHFRCKEDNEMLLSGEQCPGSQYSESNRDSACVMEEVECDQGELLALRQENQLLKQRIKGLTVLGTGSPAILSDSENQEDQVKHSQNTGKAASYDLPEQRLSCMQNDLTTEGPESLTQNEKGREHEQEELKEVSHLQIDHLKQQVVALQMKVQALSEETQQQTEELTLWRLTSQPPPTFDQFLSNKDNPDQNTAVERTHSQQHQTEEKTQILPVQSPALGVLESPSTVAVIREDELLLSCSSNKLHSHMLFSRLQHSNLPKPKSVHHCNTTAERQENNQDTAGIDKESEKENQEINLSQLPDSCPSQHKVKDGQYLTKAPNTTKTAECHRGNTVFKPNALRATNEINTPIDFSERAVKILLKSVSSQTEESFCPPSAPAAPTLHCAYTQTEEEDGEKEEEVELSDPHPVTNIPLSKAAGSGDKVFSGSFPFPADPSRLAERIRRNRAQLSAAFDDTEYEPYGLPDVVMKGFADIPSGPSCPYIVRRGLLGTSVVPVIQKDQGLEEETD